jgi:acetyltransferase-like isoleucine patch superfamily enzyme
VNIPPSNTGAELAFKLGRGFSVHCACFSNVIGGTEFGHVCLVPPGIVTVRFRPMKVRLLVAAVLALLPSRLHRLGGTLLLGWKVHPTAHLGHSIIGARRVTIGACAFIGTGNMIKGLDELTMGDESMISYLNWISGPPAGSGALKHSPKRRPALMMGRGAGISGRHIIDCTDTVTFGEFATMGGYRSVIVTHSVDLIRNRQRSAPVTIGERSAVLSNVLIMAGTSVAPRSIVSAGSVVNTPLTKELTFYRGNPAEAVRELPENLGYFVRTSPHVE